MPTAAIDLGKLPEWSEVGRHLGRARRQQGLTQRQLADLCRLRQGEISAFESGRRQPTLAQLTELARALDTSLQWFITGSSEPFAGSLADLSVELRFWGVRDWKSDAARVPGAFRPLEQLLVQTLRGDELPIKLVEAIPYVLATTPWKSRLLLAFGRDAGDDRVLTRLGWLADVTRTLNKIGQLPEAQNRRGALQTITKNTAKAPRPDGLGHPATDWSIVPAVYKRWNITYAGGLESFKQRADQLRKLKPTSEQ
jgi:transcriptional regulator with XRE-family HTH domain